MKKIFAITILLMTTLLSGCFWGEKVEVPPATVGKIMTKNGYNEGIITTSKFRLDKCWAYCDALVLLSIADQSFNERMELFMPKDKLVMSFDLRLTLTPNPKQYNSLFDRIPAENGTIPSGKIYTTYAQQIIRSQAREILSEYSIAEIASNREQINALLTTNLTSAIIEKTPFLVRHIGLADVKYPDIIVKAQENAADRREQIQTEEAQLEINKVQLARELQEQQMRRKIEVEKAKAEAEVNKILADSVTKEYIKYHELQIMYKMAESQNKVIVPSSMLQSMAGQVALGNQVK